MGVDAATGLVRAIGVMAGLAAGRVRGVAGLTGARAEGVRGEDGDGERERE